MQKPLYLGTSSRDTVTIYVWADHSVISCYNACLIMLTVNPCYTWPLLTSIHYSQKTETENFMTITWFMSTSTIYVHCVYKCSFLFALKAIIPLRKREPEMNRRAKRKNVWIFGCALVAKIGSWIVYTYMGFYLTKLNHYPCILRIKSKEFLVQL